MCVCESVYICLHYYTLVIRYHQLTPQANSYIELSLHSHQQQKKKQANKNTFHSGAVKPGQCCGRARAKITALKSLKQ